MPTVYGFVYKRDDSAVSVRQHMEFVPQGKDDIRVQHDTGTDGSYSLSLDPYDYAVYINNCPAIPTFITVLVPPPTLQRFDFKRQCKPNGTPDTMTVVYGTVAPSPDGSVIHHVVVTRRESGDVFDFWTAESGRFLTELPPGQYDVQVNGVPPREGNASIEVNVAPVQLDLAPAADPDYTPKG